MAIMPHPERGPKSPMPKIFTSMRKYMEGAELAGSVEPLIFDERRPELSTYKHLSDTIELFVELIITDNEAQTIENVLRQKGFDVRVQKWIHYQVDHVDGVDQKALAKELIDSGELLNTNKETVGIVNDEDWEFNRRADAAYFLVRDREDSIGASKTAKIHHHLGKDKVEKVQRGWFWEVIGDVDLEKLLATNVFANHHAQVLHKY